MLNNYMTEQYMSSILQQYQQSSPQKTSQDLSQNDTQSVVNEEQIRRQLNESLFKSIDDSFERQLSQITIDKTRMTDTPLRVQQMVRDPVITSDSFKKPQNNGQQNPIRNRSTIGAQTVRSQYFGQTIPQTRSRGQPYRAKVIDYSNGIIVKPKAMTNPMSQYLRPVSVTSVLTERNIDPTKRSLHTTQSVSALQSAIASISEKAVPKPMLKNSFQSPTKQPKPVFNALANTSINNSKKTVPKPKMSPSIEGKATPERDTLLNGYENEGIVRTFDLDRNQSFYCYFCNTYLKKEGKVGKHCKSDFHRTNISRYIENSMTNPLNKKFVCGQIAQNDSLDSSGLTAEMMFRLELDRILPEHKHFYYVKGIRLQNPGATDAYFCRFCEQSIQSLTNIESHLSTESHRQNESQTSLLKLLSQTTEPITGLQHITEYLSPDLLGPVYECCLCQCIEEAYDMYLHICSFKHRINLLKNNNPDEAILNSIKESPQAIKEIKKRIVYLSESVPAGAILKVYNRPNWKKLEEQKRKKSSVEVIDITDDEVEESSHLGKGLAIRVRNEEEAVDAAIAIQALKESVVKYYVNKIPSHIQRVLINKAFDKEVVDLDIRF